MIKHTWTRFCNSCSHHIWSTLVQTMYLLTPISKTDQTRLHSSLRKQSKTMSVRLQGRNLSSTAIMSDSSRLFTQRSGRRVWPSRRPSTGNQICWWIALNFRAWNLGKVQIHLKSLLPKRHYLDWTVGGFCPQLRRWARSKLCTYIRWPNRSYSVWTVGAFALQSAAGMSSDVHASDN
jgi:hypothetical protein